MPAMAPPLAIRILRGRPRLFASLCAGLVAAPFLPWRLPGPTRAVLGWDIAVAVFLVLTAQHFSRTDHSDIAEDAARQEEGEWTLFALVLLGAIMSFIAIVEFSGLSQKKGHNELYLMLVTLTLVFSWLMTNVTFAYRYAHEYYARDNGDAPAGGLEFPDEAHPDYLDFVYFAFVIGMTFQVSDVQITSRTLRRVATIHGLIGFLFNTVILALTINIAAGII
ncbi:MAG TPA: DUF1345 domain-containing protein [Stellaceae bacterium]|nr:DUF1345 domain-containing protein [Stellaceae bacterium]